MVRPAMVYISYPTELGTIYSRDELEAISTVCREADVPLYIDGARLAYGLAADGADLSLNSPSRAVASIRVAYKASWCHACQGAFARCAVLDPVHR